MRVSTLCYATEQGLGILAKSFRDAGVVTDVVVVRHPVHPSRYAEWYPGAAVANPRAVDVRRVCDELCQADAVLFFETPFNWRVLTECKRRGVRTYLMTMYECTPASLPDRPDVLLCPSRLDMEYFLAEGFTRGDALGVPPWEPCHGKGGALVYYTPVPAPADVPWKPRERANVFVHNAGHGGLRGRNGTGVLLDAWRLVKSPARLILRSQKRLEWSVDDPRIEVRAGTQPRAGLYDEGDVFVFPEKFNGLSLPLQEAYAAGMLVMATDRFPNNTYLPPGPLIPVSGYRRAKIGGPYLEFDEAVVTPEAIAAKVDEWYGRPIAALSVQGRHYAETHSWENLKGRYEEILGTP